MRQKRHTPKPKRLTYINKWDTPFRRLYCSQLHPSTGMFNFLLATFLKDLFRCARRPTAYSVSVAEGSGPKQPSHIHPLLMPFEVLCLPIAPIIVFLGQSTSTSRRRKWP